MTVLTVTITDQAFDKKYSEVAYLNRVLEHVGAQLERTRGTSATPTPVLGTSASGVPNTTVANYTYVSSASNP